MSPKRSKQGKTVETTDDVISVFTRKVINRTQWGALAVVVPLTIIQAVEGNWLIAAWLAGFATYALVLSLQSRNGHLNQRHLLVFVSMLGLAVIYSTFINGVYGFIWCFPVMVSIVFLLKKRLAFAMAIGFFIAVGTAAFYALDFATAWRGAVSLAAILILTLTLLVLLQRMQVSLTKLATTDTLTGLFNRQRLNSELEQALALHAREQLTHSVMICDIDWFKPLNDKHGHLQGDRLLIQAAEMLKQSVRTSDKVFRVGGEEFLVLLVGTDNAGACRVAEKIRRQFAEHEFVIKDAVETMTLSVGVAQLNANEHWTDWLERADERLYRAKSNGRDQVVAE